jgi:ATP-dependent DNA helicase DinG
MATETSSPTIEQALLALSDHCDGAVTDDGHGFNGRDAIFGNSLADQVRAGRRLTINQRASALKMLRTYRTQLRGYGIDYDAINAQPTGFEAPSVLLDLERTLAESDAIWGPLNPSRDQAPASQPPTNTARGILGPDGAIARKLPGYEHREPQLEMAALVEYAMGAHQNAVIEAGTGTGKSLAYLVPAILLAQETDPDARSEDGSPQPHVKTIVSTADKSLQEQIWRKDIPFLQDVMPVRFTAALLKGRSNYLCLRNFTLAQELPGLSRAGVGFASQQEAAQWGDLVDWSQTTESGDVEELPFTLSAELREHTTTDSDGCTGQSCPFHAQCWAERAKAAAKQADVIIVNHALLLRDRQLAHQSEGHARVLPEARLVVLDEAHHLEEIATDAFGSQLSPGRWTRIANGWERLTTDFPAVKELIKADDQSEEAVEAKQQLARCTAFGAEIDAFFAAIRERLTLNHKTTMRLGDERPLIMALPERLRATGSAMVETIPYWLQKNDDRERWKKLGAQLVDFAGDLEAVCTPAEPGRVVRYAELTGSGRNQRAVLHTKPVDVSDLLRARLFEADDLWSVVSTSATIATDSGMAYWCERVGCDDREDLVVGSPFDYPRAALLYLPADGPGFDPTQGRGDDSVQYLERLAAEYERLILASSGRAFCLFTSFKTLDEVYRRLSPRLTAYLVLRQGDLPRPELVKRFKQDGNAVLFGVKSFWEGVDVQGDALSLVVIDKLPFTPPDDPVWEARCEAINAKYGDRWAWFNRLAIPNAIIALKQGFGRLIRTGSDRGVVALLDGRLSTKDYGTRIIRALPPATPTRSMEAVAAFYGAGH